MRIESGATVGAPEGSGEESRPPLTKRPPRPAPAPDRPRVRPLDAFPVRQKGQTLLGLRDPEGLFEGALVASPALAVLLPMFDGTRDVEEIAAEWKQATGTAMSARDLEAVLADLARRLVLEGPAVEAARAAALAEYRSRPVRAATHAGQAYPADPEACDAFLARHVKAAGKPAVPHGVRAILAPHIDIEGGGPTHGAAAQAMAASKAEVFVVLGTAHAPIARPLALTDRDFDTPFGTLPTDRDLVARLASRAGGGLLDDELAHRGEHSVEFQALWLRWLFRDRKNLRIVPILVGSLGGHLRGEEDGPPTADGEVADAVAALREIADEGGERVAFVASVDLAHVGPRYGDADPVSEARRQEVLDADRRLLTRATEADASGWFEFLKAERDARNVCGASAVYALLSAIEGRGWRGTLLRHDDWEIDPDTGSRVSFAAVAYAP